MGVEVTRDIGIPLRSSAVFSSLHLLKSLAEQKPKTFDSRNCVKMQSKMQNVAKTFFSQHAL